MGLEAAFPAPPIGSGVDRTLALLNQFVIQSAQPIVSLSPFLIPLMIAIAIKLTAWLGPVAAIVAIVPVAGAMFNAEGVLQERALLPPPTAKLAAVKQGTPVYKKESYDDAAKAEMDKKSEKKPKEVKLSDAAKKTKAERLADAQLLKAIAASGTPLAQPAAAEQWATMARAPSQAAPGIGSSASSKAARSSSSRTEPSPATTGSNPVTGNNPVDPNAIAAKVNHINTALYGRPAPAMHSLADVQQVLNGVRVDVGLPSVAATSAQELLNAVQETSASVGC